MPIERKKFAAVGEIVAAVELKIDELLGRQEGRFLVIRSFSLYPFSGAAGDPALRWLRL